MNKYFLISLIVLMVSCGPSSQDIRDQAHEELAIKIDLLKKKKKEECEAQAFIEAEMYVDSFIKDMLLNPIGDTLYKPPIPPKPDYISVDSSVFNSQSSVKPVIEN